MDAAHDEAPRRSRRRPPVRAVVLTVALAAAVAAALASHHGSTVERATPRIDWSRLAATPATAACVARMSVLGAGGQPPGCWHPYSDASPFNQALPANVRLVPNSSRVVTRLAGFGPPGNVVAGEQDTPADFDKPTYYSAPGDPVYTVHCSEPWGRCALEGTRVRVPSRARPAAGSDGHMTVVDAIGGREYDFWRVQDKPSGGGVLTTAWGGTTAVAGDGLGSGAVAAGYGNLAGVVRTQELEQGRIDHALFLVVHCDSGKAVYPAAQAPAAGACSDTRDAPAMGARFVLAMPDAEIAALAVPAWEKTVLTAMAHYGMFVGDTTGASWGIQVESDTMYTSLGERPRFLDFARRGGFMPVAEGPGRVVYVGSLANIDWLHKLRVVAPCVSLPSC